VLALNTGHSSTSTSDVEPPVSCTIVAPRGNNFAPADAGEEGAVTSHEVAHNDLIRDTEPETTLEEREGYQIVKAIAGSGVKPQRVFHRDSKSHFAILLDDNNRKPIACLHFVGKAKNYLGLFDADKVETRHEIETLDDIYQHASKIREAVKLFA
jgi:hypothetical protein